MKLFTRKHILLITFGQLAVNVGKSKYISAFMFHNKE